ncbi:MAG: molecular chaperone GrpE [Bradymonadia bacterium]|jgi:molecular chaperone GrpE
MSAEEKIEAAVSPADNGGADAVAQQPADAEAVEVEVEVVEELDGDAVLAAAQAEAADWKARAYRVTADLENSKRRFAREREDMRKFGVEKFLKDILPVIDNLERAVQATTDPDDPVATGVKMVLRQFTSKAEIYGARPFDALGKDFDPTVHEAMSAIESTQYEPGQVAQVFQRGWMLHERLVRPAMVLVAKAPEPKAVPEAEPVAGPAVDPTEAPVTDD